MEKSTKSNPAITLVGLPWNHPQVPAQLREQVRAGLDALNEWMSAAGVRHTFVPIQPEHGGLDDLIKHLDDKDKELDGLVVGFGVRGNNDPSVTALLENVINLTHEKRPNAKVMFNTSPPSSVNAVARWFPLINLQAALALMPPPQPINLNQK
eukprot:TRINITY_DN2178_c0_g1_i1.p1 TRINITY_DN2178_c0_g1~~TRINITY_DN2178_c0_g1_i1.p1  ORF type:complete len:153 (+),score=30.13 TRINITY_DN2178_c0_g1_i1:40-498(+)